MTALPLSLQQAGVTLRMPTSADVPAIHELVGKCPPLDLNSQYAYLLQAEHHAETCVVAECDGRLVGYLSGYLKPSSSFQLFVWQVAVEDGFRGLRIGHRMLDTLLRRPSCVRVTHLETTITLGNLSSQKLFRTWAVNRGTFCVEKRQFGTEVGNDNAAKREMLYSIGPLRHSVRISAVEEHVG